MQGRNVVSELATGVLVRVVASGAGEAVAGASVAVVLDTVLFIERGDLRLSGRAGVIQIGVLVAVAALWVVNLLAGRSGELRAHESAVPVDDPQALIGQEPEQRRLMRRGQIRLAAAMLVYTLVCVYFFHQPLLALTLPAVLLISPVHAWRIAVWERRPGVVLWKPALSSVGREEWRRSPYYSTPAECPVRTVPWCWSSVGRASDACTALTPVRAR